MKEFIKDFKFEYGFCKSQEFNLFKSILISFKFALNELLFYRNE
jgi:hypothetical protein